MILDQELTQDIAYWRDVIGIAWTGVLHILGTLILRFQEKKIVEK